MVHALTEKIDKKTQMEIVKRVLEAFLSQNPKVGFSKVIIGRYNLSRTWFTSFYIFYATVQNTLLSTWLRLFTKSSSQSIATLTYTRNSHHISIKISNSQKKFSCTNFLFQEFIFKLKLLSGDKGFITSLEIPGRHLHKHDLIRLSKLPFLGSLFVFARVHLPWKIGSKRLKNNFLALLPTKLHVFDVQNCHWFIKESSEDRIDFLAYAQ